MKMRINLNKELKGIEVSFTKKPKRDVLTVLKANGFRWHRVKMLWYAKENKERLALVAKMSELIEEEIKYLLEKEEDLCREITEIATTFEYHSLEDNIS